MASTTPEPSLWDKIINFLNQPLPGTTLKETPEKPEKTAGSSKASPKEGGAQKSDQAETKAQTSPESSKPELVDEKKLPPIGTSPKEEAAEDLTQVSQANARSNPYEDFYARKRAELDTLGYKNGTTQKTDFMREAHKELNQMEATLGRGGGIYSGEQIVMDNLWQNDPTQASNVNADLRGAAADQINNQGYDLDLDKTQANQFQAPADNTVKEGWGQKIKNAFSQSVTGRPYDWGSLDPDMAQNLDTSKQPQTHQTIDPDVDVWPHLTYDEGVPSP